MSHVHLNLYKDAGVSEMLEKYAKGCDVVPASLQVAFADKKRPWADWVNHIDSALGLDAESAPVASEVVLGGKAPLSMFTYAASRVARAGGSLSVLNAHGGEVYKLDLAASRQDLTGDPAPEFTHGEGEGPMVVFLSLEHPFTRSKEVVDAIGTQTGVCGWATYTMKEGPLTKENAARVLEKVATFCDMADRAFNYRRGVVLVSTGPDVVAAALGTLLGNKKEDKPVRVLEWVRDHYEVAAEL